MAEQQSGAPAAQPNLNTVNAEFLSNRASRLDNAIAKAVESKLVMPPAPKAGKATSGNPAARPSSAPPSTPASSPSSEPGEPAAEPAGADTESAALASLGLEGDPVVADPAEALDGAAEAPAVDVAALNALAKKRDLRAIEKQLGLDEGVLGATNGEYAALRRRQGEVEATAKEQAATHTKNQQILIDKFGPAVDLIQHAQKGNLQAYAQLIERTTGIRVAAFVDHWAKNMPALDPRVLHLEQENARLRAQGQIVTQDGQIEKPAAATPAAAVAKANAYLTAEAKDHPAFKLKGGLDEVRAVWLKSYDKASDSFKLPPQKAADKVVELRKAAREQESWILSGKTPPPKPRTRAISRTGSAESQPRTQQLTREQLIERGAAEIRRAKAADAARVRR